MIIVIDNASSDGTDAFLATRPRLRIIKNPENRACAAAWNQGLKISTTPWILFLNNDVVLPKKWLEDLVQFAESEQLDIVSPAVGEGDLDYDLEKYAATFTSRMKSVKRLQTASGACFLVHRRVFEAIGGFDENFRKGGNEDDDFFWRAKNAGFRMAISGCSYIHHFGSVTQRALLAERGSTRAETIGYFRKKWGIGWVERRWMRLRLKTSRAWLKWNEKLNYGHTLLERRINGKTCHR